MGKISVTPEELKSQARVYASAAEQIDDDYYW